MDPPTSPPRRGETIIDLKPCPVCNGSAYAVCRLVTAFVVIAEMWRVSCSGCCEKTPLFDTFDEAINAWNSQAGQNTSPPKTSCQLCAAWLGCALWGILPEGGYPHAALPPGRRRPSDWRRHCGCGDSVHAEPITQLPR